MSYMTNLQSGSRPMNVPVPGAMSSMGMGPMGSSGMSMGSGYGHGAARSTMIPGMDDQSVLGDLSTRHAFVTHEVIQEGEGDVVPPVAKAQVIRYIKVHNIGTYVMGLGLFVFAMVAPQAEMLEPVAEFLRQNGFILALLPGICIAFAAAQIVKAVKTNKPHYIMGGALALMFAVGLLLFSFLGLPLVMKYLIICIPTWLWILQWCQDWEFTNMMVKFTRMLAMEHGMHHQRAREGEEEFNKPFLGSHLNFKELRWIFGCNTYKTRERMHEEQETNEMWGNFRLKDDPQATREQLITAYRLAIDSGFRDIRPAGPEDPRGAGAYEYIREPFNRLMFFMEGLMCNLSWLTSLAFAGAEIGLLAFGQSSVQDTPRMIAVCLAGATLAAFGFQIFRVQKMTSRAVGVSVAEKEWMAIDVLEKIQDKKRFRAIAQNAVENKRLNLTYLWLSAAACADYLGMGVTCKLASNCALMTKAMFESATSFEFVGFAKSRWELLAWANVVNSFQLVVLSMMAVVYFGTYNTGAEHPLFWGTYCFILCAVGITLRLRESLRLWRDIEAHSSDQNTLVFGVCVLFFVVMFINVVCLIPIIFGNGSLFGTCQSPLFSSLFPDFCADHTVTTSRFMYWTIIASVGLGLGFAGGAFLFPGTSIIFKGYKHPDRATY